MCNPKRRKGFLRPFRLFHYKPPYPMKKIMSALITASLAIFFMLSGTGCGEDYKSYNHNNNGNEEEDTPPAGIASGNYTIGFDEPRQTILGLGFEIQSDFFGTTYENDEMATGCPYDLVPSERTRLGKEMLSGFRYMRVAMGLWYRGLTGDRKNVVERYPNQTSTLLKLIEDSGVEGISMEYWSPPPYWKASDSYRGDVAGKTMLKCFHSSFSSDADYKGDQDKFLDDFSDALLRDLQYMMQQGFKISTWGLQNEPMYENTSGYSHCHYTAANYVKTFRKIAPKIRAASPDTEIIVDTNNGNVSAYATELKKAANQDLLQYVDAWVYHRIGDTSDNVMNRKDNYLAGSLDKPIYQNEYEYFAEQVAATTEEWRMVNVAQSIMNWMTFIGSQKWYWLHALKPTTEHTNLGFSFGFYRPPHDTNYNRHPNLQPGHFTYNWWNYNGIAGFLKHMPWDSVRHDVQEETQHADYRIMAWKTPEGKFVFAVTNRSDEWYRFDVQLDKSREFRGYRYDKSNLGKELSSQGGESIAVSLKPWSVEFWVEQ